MRPPDPPNAIGQPHVARMAFQSPEGYIQQVDLGAATETELERLVIGACLRDGEFLGSTDWNC